MSPTLAAFVLLGAVVALAWLTDKLVDGVTLLMRRLRIPGSVAGATLAAASTSAPELATALFGLRAARGGAASVEDLGMASIFGSALFNVAVIVAVVAVIAPLAVERYTILRDGLSYALALALLLLLLFVGGPRGALTRLEALGLVSAYLIYLFWLWRDAQIARLHIELPDHLAGAGWWESTGRGIADFALGLVGILIASHWLVESTRVLAEAGGRAFGLDERSITTLVAALAVAAGTSIPDLLTSIAAARRGEVSLALSNALGSNTFDVLICLGVPYALIGGEPVTDAVLASGFWALGATVLLIGWLLKEKKLGAFLSTALVVIYGAFVATTIHYALR